MFSFEIDFGGAGAVERHRGVDVLEVVVKVELFLYLGFEYSTADAVDEDYLFESVEEGMVEAGAEETFLELVLLDVAEFLGMVGKSLNVQVDLGFAGSGHVLQEDVLVEFLCVLCLELGEAAFEAFSAKSETVNFSSGSAMSII